MTLSVYKDIAEKALAENFELAPVGTAHELAVARRALEIACTDIPTSPAWFDFSVIPASDKYLKKAESELAKEKKDGTD
jgi:hypothetical protein